MNTEQPPAQQTLTAGQQYAQHFLPELSEGIDPDWFAGQIDGGSLIVCPCCSFLSAAPVDACGVCAALPNASRFPMDAEVPALGAAGVEADLETALTIALADVAGERRFRAETLWLLHLSTIHSADALLTARTAEARLGLAETAETE